MNADVIRKLAENEARLDYRISLIDDKIDMILRRTSAIIADLLDRPSSLLAGKLDTEKVDTSKYRSNSA
jgi:hypothetical protein